MSRSSLTRPGVAPAVPAAAIPAPAVATVRATNSEALALCGELLRAQAADRAFRDRYNDAQAVYAGFLRSTPDAIRAQGWEAVKERLHRVVPATHLADIRHGRALAQAACDLENRILALPVLGVATAAAMALVLRGQADLDLDADPADLDWDECFLQRLVIILCDLAGVEWRQAS